MAIEHPGPWDWKAEKDKNIAEVLTAAKINQWVKHLDQINSWREQQELTKYWDRGIYNAETNTRGLRVNQGDTITAQWYNNCRRAVASVKQIAEPDDITAGTKITASLINQLNFSGLV